MAAPIMCPPGEWTEIAPVGFSAMYIQCRSDLFVEFSAVQLNALVTDSGLHHHGSEVKEPYETDNATYACFVRPVAAGAAVSVRSVY